MIGSGGYSALRLLYNYKFTYKFFSFPVFFFSFHSSFFFLVIFPQVAVKRQNGAVLFIGLILHTKTLRGRDRRSAERDWQANTLQLRDST